MLQDLYSFYTEIPCILYNEFSSKWSFNFSYTLDESIDSDNSINGLNNYINSQFVKDEDIYKFISYLIIDSHIKLVFIKIDENQ